VKVELCHVTYLKFASIILGIRELRIQKKNVGLNICSSTVFLCLCNFVRATWETKKSALLHTGISSTDNFFTNDLQICILREKNVVTNGVFAKNSDSLCKILIMV
jgi:hypothetical protein